MRAECGTVVSILGAGFGSGTGESSDKGVSCHE
jgi:hypothetical protein